jgi:hypothetical protein
MSDEEMVIKHTKAAYEAMKTQKTNWKHKLRDTA